MSRGPLSSILRKYASRGLQMNRQEWLAAGSLTAGIETLETVAAAAGIGPAFRSDDFFCLVFRMFWRDFLTLRQAPGPGQTFADRRIVPARPDEIAGDLAEAYLAEFRPWENGAPPKPGPRPLGVYAELTQSGLAEWSKPWYRDRYRREADS